MSETNDTNAIQKQEEQSFDAQDEKECCVCIDACGCYVDPCCCSSVYVTPAYECCC